MSNEASDLRQAVEELGRTSRVCDCNHCQRTRRFTEIVKALDSQDQQFMENWYDAFVNLEEWQDMETFHAAKGQYFQHVRQKEIVEMRDLIERFAQLPAVTGIFGRSHVNRCPCMVCEAKDLLERTKP